MSETSPRLAFREKAGYAVGDAGANFFFQTMLYWQLSFYIDAFGIAAASAAFLFLIARLGDAVFDPIIGAISDRTNTRWGKFRPWVLFTALPYGLLFWLAFRTPHFGMHGKLVYAYITYFAMMFIYSANNTPYSALNGVMTGDDDDRTRLSSYRFYAAMTAALIVQSFTQPLVAKLGHGDQAAGYSSVIGIFAAIAVVLFVVTFFSARERIVPQRKSSLAEDVRDIGHNVPWMLMFLITLFIFVTLAMRGGAQNFYWVYFADRHPLYDYLRQWGFALTTDPVHGFGSWLMRLLGLRLDPSGANAPAVIQGLLNFLGNGVTLIGVAFSRPLASWFGKKTVFLVGLAATTVATALFALPGARSISEMFWISILWPACYGPTIPLLWVMIADVVDYSEWKTGRRATGLIYAGIVFALKAALGLGGYLGAMVLAYYNYVPNAAQTPEALRGIRLGVSIFPAAPFAIAVVCVAIYPLGKAATAKICSELEARRRLGAASA